MLNTVRKIGFWTLDFLQRGQIKKEYDEIKYIIENSDKQDSIDLQNKYLHNLLTHAVHTTGFYKGKKSFSSLQDFPVMNKQLIRNNLDNHLSALFQKDKLHSVTTSGSTGAPFTVYQDRGKRRRHTAENIYFFEDLNHWVGDKLYYLRVWNSINRKSKLTTLLENLEMVEISNLSEERIINLVNRMIKAHSPKTLLGFASSFEAISKVIKNNDVRKANVKGIITISETLTDGAREVLSNAFHCPVVSRYSNMENGFIANQQVGCGSDYYINQASYVVEILKFDEDKPAIEGERGRIVVTDLFNYGMPLIRYDTGDIATYTVKKDTRINILDKIEGRRVDFIYDDENKLISPHFITNTMWKYSDKIIQFQFIQNDAKKYLMKLNCTQRFEFESELVSDLKEHLGRNADISFEYVDEIPELRSGKKKKIVNNWNQNENCFDIERQNKIKK